MKNYFREVESDFYQYLSSVGGVGAGCRTNYMSWLRFLSEFYELSSGITDADIANIIAAEDIARKARDKYKTSSDIGNFRAALRKYKMFLNSDYRHRQEDTVIAEIKRVEQDKTITETERVAITRARIGQGKFRDDLISYWHGCSITAFPLYDILIASHIKPWKKADNLQRLDVYNGLLLLPNYDKLFDKGYISFDDTGKIIFSPYFPESDRRLLMMDGNVHLLKIEDGHKSYLKFHRDNCLMA